MEVNLNTKVIVLVRKLSGISAYRGSAAERPCLRRIVLKFGWLPLVKYEPEPEVSRYFFIDGMYFEAQVIIKRNFPGIQRNFSVKCRSLSASSNGVCTRPRSGFLGRGRSMATINCLRITKQRAIFNFAGRSTVPVATSRNVYVLLWLTILIFISWF